MSPGGEVKSHPLTNPALVVNICYFRFEVTFVTTKHGWPIMAQCYTVRSVLFTVSGRFCAVTLKRGKKLKYKERDSNQGCGHGHVTSLNFGE